MFITVQLLNGYPKSLLYAVPTAWNCDSFIGQIVRVPLRTKEYLAVVIEQHSTKPLNATYSIKEAIALEEFPADKHYQHFIDTIATYYHINSIQLLNRIKTFLNNQDQTHLSKESKTVSAAVIQLDNTKKITLTEEQQQVTDFLLPHITQPSYTPTLLHGVTGSGKTEVYKYLINHTIQQSKSIILLLPEVTLARQFFSIMKNELDTRIPIYSFHSGTTTHEKKGLWRALLNQDPMLIIGVHLPIVVPMSNLGLIIVDEEHESGYQEKKHPKINSKEAALIRAKTYNIPILLGSATPSISSLYNVQRRGWHFFQLTKRFAGNFPTIHTVFLNEKTERKHFWVSTQLYEALCNRLERKEQSIIFLNRRGVSFFVQCKQCNTVFICRSCSVSLTLHNIDDLKCHYCGYQKKLPTHCPSCKHNEFFKKGVGTQQMVSILQKLLPTARIARADLDITSKKKIWEKTVHDFYHRAIDILVGTQSITKGFHFPHVTLVGIIWADLNLNFPHYAATEYTLQQLIQVAGRAGRKTEQSTVIVQAMQDNPLFAYLHEKDYLKFYQYEIEHRATMHYPPYTRFVEIELKHTNKYLLEQEAHQLVQELLQHQKKSQYDVQILGPAQPIVHTIKKEHRRTIYLKGTSINSLHYLFNLIHGTTYKSIISWSPNPTH